MPKTFVRFSGSLDLPGDGDVGARQSEWPGTLRVLTTRWHRDSTSPPGRCRPRRRSLCRKGGNCAERVSSAPARGNRCRAAAARALGSPVLDCPPGTERSRRWCRDSRARSLSRSCQTCMLRRVSGNRPHRSWATGRCCSWRRQGRRPRPRSRRQKVGQTCSSEETFRSLPGCVIASRACRRH
jgi:hypothetical protein